jgi:integrase
MTAAADVRGKIVCPECGSNGPFHKDGHRTLSDGSDVQRYLCRSCGYRFSDPSVKVNVTRKVRESFDSRTDLRKGEIVNADFSVKEGFNGSAFSCGKDIGSHENTTVGKHLNSFLSYSSKRQVCAQKDAKNLKPQQKAKAKTAGDLLPQETKGLLTKFMAYLEREGYYKDTCYLRLIEKLAKDGANLLDPEDVKEKIAKHRKKSGEPWKDSVKRLATFAYDQFCKMEEIEWKLPHYTQRDSEIYVPDETELDQLIASTYSKRMATFLQTLKETFADPGEILRLEWRDIKDNVISIRYPVKGHLAGSTEVSAKLISMLDRLPKKSKRVFPTCYRTMETSFLQIRKRLAAKLQNPKLLNVSFKSFRHFGGTMIAEYTNGNVLTVKKILRHKSIESSMKYIHAVHFKNDDYETATATTQEEILELGKAGFTKFDERNGVHFYRKLKKFRSNV